MAARRAGGPDREERGDEGPPAPPRRLGLVAELAQLRPEQLVEDRLLGLAEVLAPEPRLRGPPELVLAAHALVHALEGVLLDERRELAVARVEAEPVEDPAEMLARIASQVLVAHEALG